MSIYALPVSVQDLLDLQESIQFFTNEAQATSQAAAINGGTSTVYDYALQLLNANLATSQVAMAVPSLILNETPAVDVLANVSLNFLPAQIDFAISQGLDPVVYAAETWAVNTANDNAAAFDALYGALSATQFATVVSTTTGVNTTAILQFINNWEDFYTHNPNAIPANLDVQSASYAAAFGDAIGNALVDDSPFTQSVNDLTENALLTIATGQYVVGVPITALPDHTPLQGEQTLRLTINVDHLSTSAPDQVFDATPASNPPFGSDNTLNTGDTLTDTAGDGTINFTTAGGLGQFLSNPPFALGVNMNGIATANILHAFPLLVPAGFAGDITGLTTVHLLAGNIGDIELGLPTNGLHTPLENIVIDSTGSIVSALPDLEVWMDAAPFDGTQEVQLTVNGVGAIDPVEVDLEVTTGTVGYGAVNVTSATGPNTLELDTDTMTSIATVNVDGSQDLTIFGSILDQDTLETFDASAATGDITAFFAPGAGGVAATGGSGDDTFTWEAPAGGTTTFTSADSFNGGGGNNRLILEADVGALLGPGVGPNITNVQVIEHQPGGGFGSTTGTISADMSHSGSANILELAADYGFNDVIVTNLITAKTVLYTGDDIDDLTLDASSLIGQVNLTMQGAAGVVQSINDLHVTVGNVAHVTSAGDAATNLIEAVNDVNANVSIDGDHQLNFGFLATNIKATNAANAYDFDGGLIDATAHTGGLQIGLNEGKQQLALGTGDDLVHQWTNTGATDVKLIQMGPLDGGGADTVVFHDTAGNANLNAFNTSLGTINYTRIEGFNVNDIPGGDGHDTITLDVGTGAFEIDIVETNNTAMFNPPAIFLASVGQVANLSGSFTDVIKFDAAVGAFTTPQSLFNAAIGAGALTVSAGVNAGGHEILFALWNNDNQSMVLGTVDPGGNNIITAGDDVDVVAVVPMSFAEFQAFGNHGQLFFV